MRFLALIGFLLWSNVANAQVIGAPPSAKLATNLTPTPSSLICGTSWTVGTHTNATLNATTAPDGSSTATSVSGDGVNNAPFCQRTLSPNISANTTYVVSLFVKKNVSDTIEFGWSDGIANASRTLFTFSTKVFSNGAAGTCTSTAQGYYPYPNGWFRIWNVGTCTSVPNPQKCEVDPWANTGGSVGTAVYVWGCQVEKGSYPTTYVAN